MVVWVLATSPREGKLPNHSEKVGTRFIARYGRGWWLIELAP